MNFYDTVPVVNYNCSDTRTYTEYKTDRNLKASEKACGPFDPTCFSVWMDYTSNAPVYKASASLPTLLPNLTSIEMAQYDAPYPSFVYRSAIRVGSSMVARIKEPGFGNIAAWESIKQFERPFLVLAGELDEAVGSLKSTSLYIDNVIGAKAHSFEHKRWPKANNLIQDDTGEELATYVSDFIQGTPLASGTSKASKKASTKLKKENKTSNKATKISKKETKALKKATKKSKKQSKASKKATKKSKKETKVPSTKSVKSPKPKRS